MFLSHSSADKPLARRLAHDLRSAGLHVWLDEWEVRVGEDFAQRIEQGLEEVDFVLVLLTRASVASQWVEREWRHKVQHEARDRRIAIVPVRGERCEIPDFLAQRTSADISGGGYPLGVRHLLSVLDHYAPGAGIVPPERSPPTRQASASAWPGVVPIGLEVGADLVPLFQPDEHGSNPALELLAPATRRALEERFGFPFPGIRIWGNLSDMPADGALVLIEEVPELFLRVGREDVLVVGDPEELAALGIVGEPAEDPLGYGIGARIAAADRAAAAAAGLVTYDAGEYLFLAVRTAAERLAALFLDLDLARHLVSSLPPTSGVAGSAVVPERVSWGELTEVLQRLVEEEISVADIGGILEALARRSPETRDGSALTELARQGLRRQITTSFLEGDSLPVLKLDPEIERLMKSALLRTSAGTYLALEPEEAEGILAAIRATVVARPEVAALPILVSDPELRGYVRRLVSLEFPWMHALTPLDLLPDAPVQPVAEIRLSPSPSTRSAGEARS